MCNPEELTMPEAYDSENPVYKYEGECKFWCRYGALDCRIKRDPNRLQLFTKKAKDVESSPVVDCDM